MKKLLVFLFIGIVSNGYSQLNVSPQFSELKGMEDQQGNTHLIYRIHTYFENDPIYQWSNHIYHYDLIKDIDTLFIQVSGIESPTGNFNHWVSDLDFWNNNPSEFIYCGGGTVGPYFEGNAYVRRFDGFNNIFGYFWGTANYVDISSSNDSLLYLGVYTDGGLGTLKSTTGGRRWDSLTVIYQFLSLHPYYENIYFVEDWDRKLFRTTDSGKTFSLVDPDFLPDTRIYYDSDQLHIYRKRYGVLKVSSNLGEQLSWQTIYTKTSTDPFYFSNDISVSGSIYISEGKNIFHSQDFGNSLNLFKNLDRKIVGIYKKPNSDKLYAATKYRIYEITPDSNKLIKKLPVIDDLKWYPLEIGNKWIYEMYREEFDPPRNKEFIGFHTMEVIGDTLLNNQKRYLKFAQEPLFWDIDTALIRPDSLVGRLYIYLPDVDREALYEDFYAQLGDTIWVDSVEYKILVYEEPFEVWGMSTSKRTVDYNIRFQGYELVKNIALFKWRFRDFFALYTKELKGCVIDGAVYGDTTVVSVDDEKPNVASSFQLEQNYPNPFNPTTKMKFTIPPSPLNPSPYQGEGQRERLITLKVYDVLGNEITTLVNEQKFAGTYEVEFDATGLPSGIYFYRLTADNYSATMKMLLLK
jgi:hypothetical protein